MGDVLSNLYWLTEAQMERLRPYFPNSRGRARFDDRRVLNGIIFINRNGLRWCVSPTEYGPPKTLYNRWQLLSDIGVFARIMMGLAEQDPDNKAISIDATYLKAHRTASSLRLEKGCMECQAACCNRHQQASCPPVHNPWEVHKTLVDKGANP